MNPRILPDHAIAANRVSVEGVLPRVSTLYQSLGYPMRRTLLALSVALIALAPAVLRGAEATYEASIQLERPKSSADRVEGGPNHVMLGLWVPDQTGPLRGLLVNPFYLKAIEQEHWRAACRHWKFGIVGANYMRVHQTEFARTLNAGLEEFATKSGRNELKQAPFLLVGMSAGAGMCIRFAEQLPERTLAVAAVCLEVGPETDRTRHVPMLTIFGEKDGRQMPLLLEKLPIRRGEFDAAWGIAVQWGRRHEWGAANNLAMPFFDTVLRQRLSAEGTLTPCDPRQAWLGDPATWKAQPAQICAAEPPSPERARQCWFPHADVANVWRAFVVPQPQLRIVSPQSQGDKQPFKVHSSEVELQVEFECTQASDLGLTEVAVFDGARQIAAAPWTKELRSLSIGKLSAGIHGLWIAGKKGDAIVEISRPAAIVVK